MGGAHSECVCGDEVDHSAEDWGSATAGASKSELETRVVKTRCSFNALIKVFM